MGHKRKSGGSLAQVGRRSIPVGTSPPWSGSLKRRRGAKVRMVRSMSAIASIAARKQTFQLFRIGPQAAIGPPYSITSSASDSTCAGTSAQSTIGACAR